MCDQQGLPSPAQALFLRLFQRRGPWFQARTFSYSEVEDSAAAVQLLVEAGLAQTDASADSDTRSQIAGAEMLFFPTETRSSDVGIGMNAWHSGSSYREGC